MCINLREEIKDVSIWWYSSTVNIKNIGSISKNSQDDLWSKWQCEDRCFTMKEPTADKNREKGNKPLLSLVTREAYHQGMQCQEHQTEGGHERLAGKVFLLKTWASMVREWRQTSQCPLIYRLRFRECYTQISFQITKATALEAAAWGKLELSPDLPADGGVWHQYGRENH